MAKHKVDLVSQAIFNGMIIAQLSETSVHLILPI